MNRPHCINRKRPATTVVSFADNLRLSNHSHNANVRPAGVTVATGAIVGRANTFDAATVLPVANFASDMFARWCHLA